MSVRKPSLTEQVSAKLVDLLFAGPAPLDKTSQAIANRNDQEVASVRVPAELLGD